MSKKERQQRQQQRLHKRQVKKQHITMYKYEGRYSSRYMYTGFGSILFYNTFINNHYQLFLN